jgi:hypothetical protein
MASAGFSAYTERKVSKNKRPSFARQVGDMVGQSDGWQRDTPLAKGRLYELACIDG